MPRNLFCIFLLTYLLAEPADSAKYAPSKPHYWRLWDDTKDILDIITSIKSNKLNGQKANPEKDKIFLCKCENQIYICIADENNVWHYRKIVDSKKGLKIDNLQEAEAKESADSFKEFVSERGYVEKSDDVIYLYYSGIDDPENAITELRAQKKDWYRYHNTYHILSRSIFIKPVNEYYATYARFDLETKKLTVPSTKEGASTKAWEKFISDKVRILDKGACEKYLSENIVSPLNPEINLKIDELKKPNNLYDFPYSKDVVTWYEITSKTSKTFVKFTDGMQQTSFCSTTEALLEIMSVRDDSGNKITPDKLPNSCSWGDKRLLISGQRYFYSDKSKNACYPIRVQEQFKGKVSHENPDLNQFQLCSDKQNAVLDDDFAAEGWEAFQTKFKDKKGRLIDFNKLRRESKIPLFPGKRQESLNKAILADCSKEIDLKDKTSMIKISQDKGIIQVDGKFMRISDQFKTEDVNLIDELVKLAEHTPPDQNAIFFNIIGFNDKKPIEKIKELHNFFVKNVPTGQGMAFIQKENKQTRWDSNHNPGSLVGKVGGKFYYIDSNGWKLADCTLRIDPHKQDSLQLSIKDLFKELVFMCEGTRIKCPNTMDSVIGYLNKKEEATTGQLNTCEFEYDQLKYKVKGLEGLNIVECERVFRPITPGK